MTFIISSSQNSSQNQNPGSLVEIDKIKNQNVLVRVCFDIPLPKESKIGESLDQYQKVIDLSRIHDATASIKTLYENNNKIILISKWGKLKIDSDFQKYSFTKLTKLLKNLFQEKINPNIKLEFVNQFSFDEENYEVYSPERIKSEISQDKNTITLLENIHFDGREKSKSEEDRKAIAQVYAGIASCVVDECFPSSHRTEATNTEIKKLLPFSYGVSYSKETESLNKVKTNPKKSFVFVMGGAKLETKLPLIEKMLPLADQILVGGMLCFTLIKAAKYLGMTDLDIKDSPVEEDFLDTAKSLLKNHGNKIILPVDLVFEDSVNHSIDPDKDGKTLSFARDVGPKTIIEFGKYLSKAKTIFWNGPMGFFEKPPFDKGTKDLAHIITENNQAFTVLGGGDTGSSLDAATLKKFDLVSMGGGATLEYLSK